MYLCPLHIPTGNLCTVNLLITRSLVVQKNLVFSDGRNIYRRL